MSEQSSTQYPKIHIWDLPTRLFHWSLVILVAVSWWSVDQGRMTVHMWSGYCVLTLLGFRLLWGIWGSTTARFGHFVKGPRPALAHLGHVFKRPAEPTVGHNPLGGWVIILFLLLLLFQAGTGLFANDDIFIEGPLTHLVSDAMSDRLTGLHESNFNLLLGLIGVHIAAAFFYLLVRGENLIRPMITGRKAWPTASEPPRLRFISPLLGLVVLGVAATGVWALVNYV